MITAFVVQTSQSLQSDNGQITASLLFETNQLLRAAGNQTAIRAVPTSSLVPGSQTHTSIDNWINGLFLISLVLSVLPAIVAVSTKLWIQVCELISASCSQIDGNL